MMTVRLAIVAWLGLFALLALTVSSTLLPLGVWNTVLNLAFAAGKAAIIGLIFMHLRKSGILVSLTVLALGLWLGILILMTLVDVLNR
jgi:caa(3)-type oxidase subunit IV